MADNSLKEVVLARVAQMLASGSKHVYSPAEIGHVFDQLRSKWSLPKSLTRNKFRDLITASGVLKEIKLSATYAFESKRYSWGPISNYELAMSLRPGSYLSHGTAAYLHGLAEHEPDLIYVNKEQSGKNQSGSLSQAGLNKAFSNKQRQSSYIVTHLSTKIVLLNGKDTDRLGVQETTGPQGEGLEYTNMERTLIDITVRPAYAGGVENVLHSYIEASQKISVERLAEMLVQLEYLYPYHQAVGFYLQSAGYKATALALLREPGLRYDFFLAHAMNKTKYDRAWRIHYPADFPRP